MAILPILEFPDPRLRTVAEPVVQFDDQLVTLTKNMLDTMYQASGIGLAATQVNIHQRVIVVDISDDRDQPLIFINPEITVLEGPEHDYDEGCLSVPGFHETVSRPENIIVKAFDCKGKPFEIEPEGLLTICLQHELDHLNGKLFVDYISSLKRRRIRKKLEKLHKQAL